MNTKDKLLFVPSLMVAGIAQWVDPPTWIKFEYDHDWERKRVEAALDHVRREGSSTPVPFNMGVPPWPYKVIPLKYWEAQYKQWVTVCVCIDQEKREIDFGHFTSGWILGKRSPDSGELGIALLSLPVTLPLSPLLVAADKYYGWQERKHGMSRHAIALLKNIKNAIDAETYDELAVALRNTWEQERR